MSLLIVNDACFVDIGGVVDHHCLQYMFIAICIILVLVGMK
jgi:hypothetical protein